MFEVAQYLTIRYNNLDVRHLRHWIKSAGLGKGRKVKPARPNLKRDQVPALLAQYDHLFKLWGWRYSRYTNSLMSDDIANDARLAYYTEFIPHCDLGMDKCKSVVNKSSLQPVKTSTGKLARRKQIVYNESGEVIRHTDGKPVEIRKPIYRIKREFSPSCEKSALSALQKAKYSAMNRADYYAKSGKVETVFSDLELPTGRGLVEYLEKVGVNPVDYANSVGINTPWNDHTITKLTAETSYQSVKQFLADTGLNQFEDCRLSPALRIADKKGVLPALLKNSVGYTFHEIADQQGLSDKALLIKLTRYRRDLKRHAIA